MKPTAMPSFQIGIWRRSSGVRDAFWRSASVSRTRRLATSILLMNRKRGMSASSSSRSTSSSAGILRSSASQTTTAASQAGITVRMSCANSTEPGQSTKVKVSSRNLQVAKFGSTLIAWARASALESPTMLPVLARPARSIVPVRSRMASRREVLPLWKGPTMAMHRGPASGLPFAMIIPPLAPRLSRALDQECSASPAAMASPRRPRRKCKTAGRWPGRVKDLVRASAAAAAARRIQRRGRCGDEDQVGDADREVEAGLAGDRERLQGDRAVRAADEDVGADAADDGGLGRRAGVDAGEHAPRHRPAGRRADVEAELADRAGVDLVLAA